MSKANCSTLQSYLAAADMFSSTVAVGNNEPTSWGALSSLSNLQRQLGSISSSLSVVVATIHQLSAIQALIQLDGLARRIVLYPPDLSREHLCFVADSAKADVILTDDPSLEGIDARVRCMVSSAQNCDSDVLDQASKIESEWVLLTSGTTGVPKLVAHSLESLAGAITPGANSNITWATFYDIRRYGGLQIFLRAAIGGTSLVLKDVQESTAEFLSRAGRLGVTHILGTPSHWRRVLMSPAADNIVPTYVRLSGEIADQAILNQLRAQYPHARIAHAFASTEAGVVFEVNDCLMGFPAEVVGSGPHVDVKVEGNTLRVRSPRTASRYLGQSAPVLRDDAGFVDTGDAIELRNCRYYFVGRRDGIINVGGLKVHPEEIEAVINRHPDVSMSLVKAKKNPVTGALVVADVVLKSQLQLASNVPSALEQAILQFCRQELALYKVPAVINFVSALAVAQTGKLIRHA
jgi:acyl-coenzyme A synthetase/AMP-(fatty) acid ligase